MKFNQPHWFAAVLLGSALSLPPAVFAAEKGDMMKDEKAKMMKDDKMTQQEKGGSMKADAMKAEPGKMMKDDMKESKSKTKKSAEKMKIDKMDEMKK
jgi:hypothetical protein